jgi:DNA-binding NtrC family response regulator
VKVNLGGVPPALFESEMFGHVRGAFTDARENRRGRFEAAEGGTIFLDEIGELDAAGQVKLLRVLQDRRYEVLGSSATRPLDVRVISATNQDLGAAIAAGRFREDLLYRINLIHLRLPSLSERPGDIVLLARHYLRQAASSYDRDPVQLESDAEVWLRRQPWPGNVRQLKHLMARSLLLSNGPLLTTADFQRTLAMDSDEPADTLPTVGSMTMEEIERAMILKSLRHHEGNVSRVAESLGLSRAALYRRFEKYGIEP